MLKINKSNKDSMRPLDVVDFETSKLVLDNEVLMKVSHSLLEEFQKGLANAPDSCLKMSMTYVRDIPDGSEQGKIIVIDFADSTFRILCVELYSYSTRTNIQSKNYEISKSLMEGPGQELFDYIADCLNSFTKSLNLDQLLSIAVTFGFPCNQTSINNAILLRWAKGFSCSGVVGKDVGQILKETIIRRCNIKLNSISIVNDTTGTLMSCAHIDKNCYMAIIISAGCNACYMEDLNNVKKWPENKKTQPHQMIINTEWGIFGDNNCLNFIRTKYDIMLDKNSDNPGEQIFEKMISGMYLGELFRIILIDFAKCNLLFNGEMSSEFKTPYFFKTIWLSVIQDDVNNNRNTETENLLKLLNIKKASKTDYKIIQMTCTRVVQQSAFLVSAGIATILNKMHRPRTTVAVDGTMYRLYPTYKIMMENKITELISANLKFKLLLSKDGSGRGSALVAASELRYYDILRLSIIHE